MIDEKVHTEGSIDNNKPPRLVEIQVKVPNRKAVISALQGHIYVESPEHAESRLKNKPKDGEAGAADSRTNGKLVLKQTMSAGLTGVLDGLRAAGYKLICAFVDERQHKEGRGSYFVERFIFCAPAYFEADRVPEEFKSDISRVMGELMALLSETRGRVRSFDNSYVDPVTEKVIPDQRVLLINYDWLQPMVDKGKPVMVMRRKGSKKHGTREKVPMAPKVWVRFDGVKIEAATA
jgi:hypothetical protein